MSTIRKTVSFERKGPWFVVNMCSRWNKKEIQRAHKPTIVYKSLAEAFVAAQKMAETHTQGNYAIFECIGGIKPTKETIQEIKLSRM